MISISEWLPNPKGDDSLGEWVEFVNTGPDPVDLSGWRIENSGGKKFIFGAQKLGAREFLLVARSRSKLVLRNQNESLALYDARGAVADHSAFKGSAPEGKSFGRVGDHFIFSLPSPGAPNRGGERALIADAVPPAYGAVSPQFGVWNAVGASVGVGFFLAALITIMIRRNDYLYHVFFGGNEEIR